MPEERIKVAIERAGEKAVFESTDLDPGVERIMFTLPNGEKLHVGFTVGPHGGLVISAERFSLSVTPRASNAIEIIPRKDW